MAFLVEVPLSDGQTVLAEVTSQIDGMMPAGPAKDVLGKLPEAFRDGMARISAFAGEALDKLRDVAEPPDVVSVEFGLKLSAKAGVVVAECTGEAHMKVSVEWHRREPAAG